MEKNRHALPAFILTREPRPADRETRMYPLPGKWNARPRRKEENG